MKYVLPALRGCFGDWIYYTSMMPQKLVASEVSYVTDVHKNKQLSDMVQRALKKKRLDDIVRYIRDEKDRFFNALVLAVYEGTPEWYPGDIQSNADLFDKDNFPDDMEGCVGFLRFTGKEKLITIDGQHRLGGIKKYVGTSGSNNDLVPVIFVSHNTANEQTLERTRRLFTALNKHAQAVKKWEIIALDENDLMAIITRQLVEYHDWFSNGRIKIRTGSNVEEKENAFTSIENLYDILTVLFTKIAPKVLPDEYQGRSNRDLLNALKNGKRLDKESVDLCYKLAVRYFENVANICPELANYFEEEDFEGLAFKARKDGVVLFRPKGLLLFANLAIHLSGTLEERFAVLNTLPNNLKEYPYKGLLWTSTSGMEEKNEAGVRNLFLSMLGAPLNTNAKRSATLAWGKLIDDPDCSYSDVPKSLDEMNELLA